MPEVTATNGGPVTRAKRRAKESPATGTASTPSPAQTASARVCVPAGTSLPTPGERHRAAELFRALGHGVRLHVLLCLSRCGGLTVSELLERIGIEQSALSHQLRALREARLVRPRRSGRHIYYELYDSHVSHVIEGAISHVKEDADE